MSDVVSGCFTCIAIIVIVLFNVGCFTSNWIRTEEVSVTNFTNFTNTSTVSTTKRICHHGLLYSNDCPDSKNVFDDSLVLLNIAISVCFTVIPFFWCCSACMDSICCDSCYDDTCSACCSCFYSLFYAIGGLLGLVSTVIVVANFENSDLGWSFYLTVAAIAIVLLQVVLLLSYGAYSRGSKEKFSMFMVYRRRHYYRI
uniref:Uncharacterized protein LOC111105243 n=1 Tax=Crassostrea virginica TaxID=6565 RepID=A0A8B8AVJ1_CRAVI|nr:uncharacterized protein LOC111105243 [Crassostrea virginica]XP_022295123.1 uncharacterized protein LOC111105243 [Crassostrea virginica]